MSIFLTCNAGSSNTKLAAFECETMERVAHGTFHNNPAALTQWLCSAGSLDIVAITHRVVHGGMDFTEPTRINDNVLEQLNRYIPLAPLHQPAALHLIEETRKLYPDAPHIACFDTAFHHTIPHLQRRFALPRALHDAGIMRYGFHGLSYQHIADVLRDYPKQIAKRRVIVAHLGGGSSACAMENLKSVANTMGFSTLDGLMMGTRCGALDAGVLLYLLTEKNMSVPELSNLLSRIRLERRFRHQQRYARVISKRKPCGT
jgi:acetate kinase